MKSARWRTSPRDPGGLPTDPKDPGSARGESGEPSTCEVMDKKQAYRMNNGGLQHASECAWLGISFWLLAIDSD